MTNYQQIFNKLANAKKNGTQKALGDSLSFFAETIKTAISQDLTAQTFANFIQDEQFILPTETNYVVEGVTNASLETDGLLSQILESYGYKQHKELSNQIKDKIYSLHSNLSRGKQDNQHLINELEKMLDTILLIVA